MHYQLDGNNPTVCVIYQIRSNTVTNLDSVLKSGDITLLTKVCIVKAMVFPVVKYGCERWTIKKAELQRIDAFELWLDKTLESLLDYKEIQPVHQQSVLNIHWED